MEDWVTSTSDLSCEVKQSNQFTSQPDSRLRVLAQLARRLRTSKAFLSPAREATPAKARTWTLLRAALLPKFHRGSSAKVKPGYETTTPSINTTYLQTK